MSKRPSPAPPVGQRSSPRFFDRRPVLMLGCAIALACGKSEEHIAPPSTASAGPMGLPVAPIVAGAPAPPAVGTAGVPSLVAAGAPSANPAPGAAGSMGVAGAPPAPPTVPPTTQMPGGTHETPTHVDHCVDGFAPEPSDAELTSVQPDEWRSPRGQIDLFLPNPVLSWMHKNKWMESHDAWHNVRRCNSFISFPNSPTVNICDEHPDLIAKHQECSGPEDGYAFLVEHRHMLQGFKQAFPKHTELFAGFPRFPFEAKDVPEQWRDRFGTGWSAQIRSAAEVLENIENNVAMFPTEGHLGAFIQCGGMGQRGGGGGGSLHAAMHFKWSISGSPHALGDQVVDLGNYMFWKLHGWIDHVWERYRVAKDVAPNDAPLKQALLDNCREMQRLGRLFDASIGVKPPTTAPTEPEYGDFHTQVRPVLNELCSTCHSGTAPMGGLSFARELRSRDITAQLVGVASKSGGQFKRVVAGRPNESWLFLKVNDMAKAAGCTGTCNVQNMPPTGQVELSTAQLEAIRSWIANGAAAPSTTP